MSNGSQAGDIPAVFGSALMQGDQEFSRLAIRIESPRNADISALIWHLQSPKTVAALQAPNTEVLVARLNDEPVGCVALVDQLGYGEVQGLFVNEAARGRGISAALIAALEAAARDLGLRRVVVAMDEAGETLASLLAGAGFAHSPSGELEKVL